MHDCIEMFITFSGFELCRRVMALGRLIEIVWAGRITLSSTNSEFKELEKHITSVGIKSDANVNEDDRDVVTGLIQTALHIVEYVIIWLLCLTAVIFLAICYFMFKIISWCVIRRKTRWTNKQILEKCPE